MNTPNDQALAKEFFTATLIYPKEEKAFKASNVSITDDTTESGVKCWTITASEYTKDEKDGTVEIHTLLLYIKRPAPITRSTARPLWVRHWPSRTSRKTAQATTYSKTARTIRMMTLIPSSTHLELKVNLPIPKPPIASSTWGPLVLL